MTATRIKLFALKALLLGLCAQGFASGAIQLTAYPPIGVADGSSTVTITATARNSSGALVPDGTVVRFNTSHGMFRDVDVATTSGTARAILIAPNEEVVARITASAATIGTINTLEVEFVKDRSVLAAARQYVDVSAPEYLSYSVDLKIISASGRDRGASLRFKDIVIEASDMQIDLQTMTVLATDAVLTAGSNTIQCQFLRYILPRRRGIAIARVEERTGGYDLVGATPSLSEGGIMPTRFEFADLGLSGTSIHAERIVAFPHREIQFHRAVMYVGDTKVLSLPLYAISPNTPAGLFSEHVVGFAGGGLQLNYPHYLMLSPTNTSVLRLRSGQDFARGAGAARGIYLDLENTYMAGSAGEGSVTLGGIGRKDMGLSFRHTHNFGDRTNASAMLDFPGFRSMYGNLNASHRFDDFNVSLSGSSSRSWQGNQFESQRLDMNVETHTQRLANFPLTFTAGLTANASRAKFGPTVSEREAYGFRSRFNLLPQQLWEGGSLTTGLTFSQLWGRVGAGTSLLSTTSLHTNVGSGSLRLTYDFAADSFTSALMGRHRLGGEFFMDTGTVAVTAFGGKSIDLDGMNMFVDASYRLSSLWRVGGMVSYDRYLGSVISDQAVLLGYRVGGREFGVTYSLNNKRFGFELLSVPIR